MLKFRFIFPCGGWGWGVGGVGEGGGGMPQCCCGDKSILYLIGNVPTPLTLQNLGYFVSDIAELGLRQLFLFSDNALKYEISLTRWSIDTGIRWQLFGLNTVSDCRHSCGVCSYISFYC